MIYAVVVTYNGMQWYDRCIGSLLNSDEPVRVIVIDNASSDGSANHIESHFPEVHLIRSSENLGFAKANNIGIRYAYDKGADYVFLLNQDAWVEGNTLCKLVQTFRDNENVGVVSPMHFNGEGTDLDWKFATCMSGDFVSDAYMNRLKPSYPIRSVNAAAWLISRHCIETIGGFDTNLFVHYGEDGNYCQRIQYHGLKLLVNTHCRIYHDREFRRGHEDSYQKSVFDQTDTNRKLEWGNINVNLDVEKQIQNVRRSIMKCRLKFKFDKVRQLQEEESFLERVLRSREVNSHKGLSWL